MSWPRCLLIVIIVIFKLCSVESATSKRVQKCQEYSAKVFGTDVPTCSNDLGYVKSLKDFPHNAILGYRNNDETDFRWLCIGTLVSTRYVLTVAHCLKDPHVKSPVKVKLGTLVPILKTDAIPTDYDVEQVIIHPNKTKTRYNNIGLIKLSRQVIFTENVRPICLPDTDLTPNIAYRASFESFFSRKPDLRPLLKFELTSISYEACNEAYRDIIDRNLNRGITNQFLCHQVTTKESDPFSCSVEWGAPVYIEHPEIACSHLQLGSTVLALRCDRQQPDVAVKVFEFIDWIDSIIWAEDENDLVVTTDAIVSTEATVLTDSDIRSVPIPMIHATVTPAPIVTTDATVITDPVVKSEPIVTTYATVTPAPIVTTDATVSEVPDNKFKFKPRKCSNSIWF